MTAARLFIISGPSAVGKGTIVKRILKSDGKVHLSVCGDDAESPGGRRRRRQLLFHVG